MKLKLVTSPDSLYTQASPEWIWSDDEREVITKTRLERLRTRDDYLEMERADSEKEAYQPFLASYLDRVGRCLVVGSGWGVVERRWISRFRDSGRRLLLTDANDLVLEPLSRLWGAETMPLDVLDVPPSLHGQFDVACALSVEYQFDDGEYVKMVSNMKRCLDAAQGGRIVLIVANIRAATIMNPAGLVYRLLDLDQRLPSRMLSVAGRSKHRVIGWQRTLGAHRRILARAGLRVTRVIPLFDDGSLWGRFSKIGASKAIAIEAMPRDAT